MNNIAMAQAVQRAVKPKFRGHTVLKSKVKTHYPANLEREYVRIVNAYMGILEDLLTRLFKKLHKSANADSTDIRLDDSGVTEEMIEEAFLDLQKKWLGKTQTFGLQKKLTELSELTEKLSISQWKRVVKKTLGIDIMGDYYKGDFFRDTLKLWAQTNVNLITSIPKETLANVQTIVMESFKQGKTNKSLAQEILDLNTSDFGFTPVMEQSAFDKAMAEYNKAKRKAQFIARDQMGKLNADITQSQQEDAGVTEYVWDTSGDGRVRDRHRELDGQRCKWNDPPVVDERTKRKAHPGQDFRCRCVALPVFDIEGLDLPWENSK